MSTFTSFDLWILDENVGWRRDINPISVGTLIWCNKMKFGDEGSIASVYAYMIFGTVDMSQSIEE